jgi:type IV pilus assembly protein PilY1
LYAHTYYVDGGAIVMDAFWDGAWHTVLVSGLGAGGQGVFALDVTTAAAANDSDVAAKVLWEFTDDSDRYTGGKTSAPTQNSDLGYTFSRPNVVRLSSGKWAALFGNGYNNTEADGLPSDKGNAVLYVVDIKDGSLIKKVDTNVGASASADGLPNGLSTVAVVDESGDYVADKAYAGDLFGNLWRFDLSDPSVITATKIFQTSSGQPITSRPQVIRAPDGQGNIVLFGTGSYFQLGEGMATGQTTQTFYGIWDNPEENQALVPKSALLEQKVLREDTVTTLGITYTYRLTTNNSIDWNSHRGWYMNLVNTGVTPLNNKGERAVSDPVIRNGRVIFATLLPDPNACGYGNESGWLMELDAESGGQPKESPFYVRSGTNYALVQLDKDGNGNTTGDSVPPSGRKSTVGIVPTPAIVARPGGQREYKYLSGSKSNSGVNVEVVVESPGASDDTGRRSWSQLFK